VDRAAVLELFDRQMRREVSPLDPAVRVVRDAQTVLVVDDDWSALLWSALDETTADAVVARVVEQLSELQGHVEWKLYGHDRPPDLPERLLAAGLVPEDAEAVLVAELSDLPDIAGADVRIADTPELIDTWADVNTRAFGESFTFTGRELRRALDRDPPPRVGVMAFADGTPVSAGRIDFNERSDFASIWGGGTVPEWRGRGMYRATVAKRAALARERGYRYLQVDALPTSRPILERLGFVAITTTTPFTFPRATD
jgi:GNAT superfamily N-acetyltransferase